MSIFPNVPNLPGVPPLARSALASVSAVQGVVAGISNTLQFFQGQDPGPVWGVFDSNFKSVVDADSFLAFSNSNPSRLADYPIQDGNFVSYDKVRQPFVVTCRIAKGGSVADRAALLAQLDALKASLQLYTMVTPEKSYLQINMEDYQLVRTKEKGAYFFTELDLFFREVLTQSAVYTTTSSAPDTSNAQAPSAQPPANQGIVAPDAPSAAAQNEATTILSGGFP